MTEIQSASTEQLRTWLANARGRGDPAIAAELAKREAEGIHKFRLKVWERADGVKNPLVDITMKGTRNEAERKLSDLWDKNHGVIDPSGPRNSAALWLVGQRAAISRFW